MAALMQPAIGGMVAEQSEISFDTDSRSETSQIGACTVTPCSRNSCNSVTAAWVLGPDRDGRIKFLTPFCIIHLQMPRPIPPSPPAIMYEASLWKCHFGDVLMNFFPQASARSKEKGGWSYWNDVGRLIADYYTSCMPAAL